MSCERQTLLFLFYYYIKQWLIFALGKNVFFSTSNIIVFQVHTFFVLHFLIKRITQFLFIPNCTLYRTLVKITIIYKLPLKLLLL
jgi:hypothetical protein